MFKLDMPRSNAQQPASEVLQLFWRKRMVSLDTRIESNFVQLRRSQTLAVSFRCWTESQKMKNRKQSAWWSTNVAVTFVPPLLNNSLEQCCYSKFVFSFTFHNSLPTSKVAGVAFSDSDSAPASKFLNPDPKNFQIRESVLLLKKWHMYKDYTDSCYWRKWQVTPDPEEKRRSAPALQIRGHL